ncbi:conserved hypothetical protein [Alphaproteobacteria bacterium]
MSKVEEIKSLVEELSGIIQNEEAKFVKDHLEALSNKEQMSYKEIFTLFTHYDSTGASIIETAISRSTQHLEAILDNQLINKLNDKELCNLLNYKDSSGNSPLCFTIRKGAQCISSLLNSKAFSRLDSSSVFQILNEKCEADHPSLWSLAKKGKDDILAVLENDALIKKLSDIQKKEILNNSNLLKSINSEENLNTVLRSNFINSLNEDLKVDVLSNPQPPNGDTVIRAFIRKKAIELLKVFLNSDVLTTLSSEGQFKVITTAWTDTPHILKFLIKQDTEVIDLLFKSSAFKNLNSKQQKSAIFFTEDISFWEFLSTQSKYVEKLLDNHHLSQDLLSYLASNFLKTAEFSGHYTIENNSKKDVFQNTIIKVARDYAPYKEILSEDGYSLLYYLSTKGFNSTTLQNFEVEGFKLVFPNNKNVSIYNEYHLYESLDQSETVIYLRGPDGTKPINIPGMVSSLHKCGFNILVIDSRDNNNINSNTLKKTISDYAKNHLIKFFIINAHGAGNKYSGMPEIYYGEKSHKAPECSDAEIWLFKSPDKLAQVRAGLPEGTGHYILAKTLIKEVIAKSINKDLKVPINVFLTSCNGQLVEKWAFKELPYNSTVVTVGEHNCKSIVIHGRVGDLMSITNFINQNYQLNIENILTHYLLNIKQGLASPTYVKSGIATVYLANLTTSEYWIQNLSKNKADLLTEKLCFTNKDCKDNIGIVLKEIREHNISLHNITVLKAKGDTYNFANKLGIIEAINFHYASYCTELFGKQDLNYTYSNMICNLDSNDEQASNIWYENPHIPCIIAATSIFALIGYEVYQCIHNQQHAHID